MSFRTTGLDRQAVVELQVTWCVLTVSGFVNIDGDKSTTWSSFITLRWDRMLSIGGIMAVMLLLSVEEIGLLSSSTTKTTQLLNR
jgi:hypothetical protein